MSDTEPEDEEMAETAEKLDSALEGTETADSADSSDEDDVAALLDRAETDVESLLGVLNGEESYTEARDDIEDLVDVIEETDELLETVAVSELPEAVELSELPSAIEGEEVPAAIANAEPRRAIDLTRLASLVEFSELWDAVDIREFMQNKDELEDAAGGVTDDEGGGDDSSLTDSLDSPSLGSGSSAEGESESFIGQEEAMQAAIQSKLRDAAEEFRESVLGAREQVKEARDTAQAQVEAKTGGGAGQPSLRNPTAYSTMVAGWKPGGWSSANFSTVPESTQHSSAPGHFRIYGRRFDERASGKGGDDE